MPIPIPNFLPRRRPSMLSFSRLTYVAVLAVLAFALSGCCLWNCPPPLPPTPLKPLPQPADPRAVANRLATALLAGPFLDESQTRKVYLPPEVWSRAELAPVYPWLVRALMREPHLQVVNGLPAWSLTAGVVSDVSGARLNAYLNAPDGKPVSWHFTEPVGDPAP